MIDVDVILETLGGYRCWIQIYLYTFRLFVLDLADAEYHMQRARGNAYYLVLQLGSLPKLTLIQSVQNIRM